MSMARIALDFGDMFFIIDLGSRLKVSFSMSANIGIAPQWSMDAAQALIVHGDKIISSPGSISIAPTAHIRPEVQELTLIACLTLIFSLQAYSNSFTLGPP